MKTTDVTALYDHDYVEQYDREFIFSGLTKFNTEFEVALLASLIGAETRWLDVACGTGYYLSRFPDAARGGIDLSPAMLDMARPRNPGATFRQGDYRDAVGEWRERWSLVSCMWAAYSYVDSMEQAQAVFANIVDWTQRGGTVFVPTIDLEDLKNVDLPFSTQDSYDGELWVTGCSWSWRDGFDGRLHEQMVAPQTAQIVQWLGPWFDAIDVVRYPAPKPDWPGRKAIVARNRRAAPDADRPAVVTWQPRVITAAPADMLRDVPTATLARALLGRVASRPLSRLRSLRSAR